jgi:DNA ligase 1
LKTIVLIDRLEATSGTNEKKALLKEAWAAGERDFFVGAKFAYNKLISFGVKKVPPIEVDDDEDGTLTFSDFMALCHRLRKRELTGHAARDAIIAAAERSDAKWNKFYRRVLLRDLKVNVGTSLINAVLKEVSKTDREALDYVIPQFECQLAEDSKKHPKKMTGRKLLDIKLDGARMLSVLDVETKTVRMFTRSGIETDRFPHISESLEKMIPELPSSVVIDGEILSDTFQGLMSQFQRKDAQTEDMKLGLFDIVPLADFQSGHCSLTQRQRHEMLCELQTTGLLRRYCGDKVYVIPKLDVDLNTDEGTAQMREFFGEACQAGFEGIMIKDPEAPYEGRKWSAWLKWKPTISVTLKVVALEQGKPDSEFADTLGALVCEGVDDVSEEATGKFYSQIKIKSRVGSGYSIEQRQAWWDNPEDIVGFLVEVEADAVSLNQNSTDTYSLRFPRLKGIRGSRPGEKI